jgi:chromosome partition protein MukE
MSSRFASLEEVVHDPVFPAVDIALRRGRHIDRDDGEWYAFVSDAQDHLELLYRRYGCELVTQSDGYFYLLPAGDQLSRRHLTAGEMLVGQTLALQFLDPATIKSAGVVTRTQMLGRLAGLVGDRELARALEPRRRRFDDERVVHEIIRRRVAEAIRRLEVLGFIEVLDQDRLRLRSPLLRFAEPVRGLQNADVAMKRLIERGELTELEARGDQGAAEAARAGAAALPDEGGDDVDSVDEDESLDEDTGGDDPNGGTGDES